MDIRPIRTDDDHTEALREIERLMGHADDSPENDKLDVLATLVEVYEARRWPITAASPRDILAYATTDMGRSQTELADLLGSRSQASDLLSGRRPVSLQVARKISAAWNIPIQLLVVPNPDHFPVATKKTMNHRDRAASILKVSEPSSKTKKTPKRIKSPKIVAKRPKQQSATRKVRRRPKPRQVA